MKRLIALGLLLSLCAPAAPAAQGPDAVAAARKLYEEKQDSLVVVLAVASIQASAGGQTAPAQEQKIETLGTVIDPSGLTVISYSGIDPSAAAQGRKVRTPQGMVTLEIKVDFKEVKIRLADGTEVPANLVLTDKDLDLAFVLPDAKSDEAQGATFKPVDLAKAAKGKVLDEVIMVARLGKSRDRRPVVRIGRVAAVVKKPREFYVTSVNAPGAPVFTAAGEIVGVAVHRMFDGKPSGTVILPAADLRDSAKQALAKKPAKPKKPD